MPNYPALVEQDPTEPLDLSQLDFSMGERFKAAATSAYGHYTLNRAVNTLADAKPTEGVLLSQPTTAEDVAQMAVERPGLKVPVGVPKFIGGMMQLSYDNDKYMNLVSQAHPRSMGKIAAFGAWAANIGGGMFGGASDPKAWTTAAGVGAVGKVAAEAIATRALAKFGASELYGSGAARVATLIAQSAGEGAGAGAGMQAATELQEQEKRGTLQEPHEYIQSLQNIGEAGLFGAIMGVGFKGIGLTLFGRSASKMPDGTIVEHPEGMQPEGGTPTRVGGLFNRPAFTNLSAEAKAYIGKVYKPWSQDADIVIKEEATGQMLNGAGKPNVDPILKQGMVDEGVNFRNAIQNYNQEYYRGYTKGTDHGFKYDTYFGRGYWMSPKLSEAQKYGDTIDTIKGNFKLYDVHNDAKSNPELAKIYKKIQEKGLFSGKKGEKLEKSNKKLVDEFREKLIANGYDGLTRGGTDYADVMLFDRPENVKTLEKPAPAIDVEALDRQLAEAQEQITSEMFAEHFAEKFNEPLKAIPSSTGLRVDTYDNGSQFVSHIEEGDAIKVLKNKSDGRGIIVGADIKENGINGGIDLIKTAMQEAQKRGLKLTSDSVVTPNMMKVYKKLEKEGYKLKINPNVTERIGEGGSVKGKKIIQSNDGTSPVVEFISEPELQKQQNSKSLRQSDLMQQYMLAQSMRDHLNDTHEPLTQAEVQAYGEELKSSGMPDNGYTTAVMDEGFTVDDYLEQFNDKQVAELADAFKADKELMRELEQTQKKIKQQPKFAKMAQEMTDCILKGAI